MDFWKRQKGNGISVRVNGAEYGVSYDNRQVRVGRERGMTERLAGAMTDATNAVGQAATNFSHEVVQDAKNAVSDVKEDLREAGQKIDAALNPSLTSRSRRKRTKDNKKEQKESGDRASHESSESRRASTRPSSSSRDAESLDAESLTRTSKLFREQAEKRNTWSTGKSWFVFFSCIAAAITGVFCLRSVINGRSENAYRDAAIGTSLLGGGGFLVYKGIKAYSR